MTNFIFILSRFKLSEKHVENELRNLYQSYNHLMGTGAVSIRSESESNSNKDAGSPLNSSCQILSDEGDKDSHHSASATPEKKSCQTVVSYDIELANSPNNNSDSNKNRKARESSPEIMIVEKTESRMVPKKYWLDKPSLDKYEPTRKPQEREKPELLTATKPVLITDLIDAKQRLEIEKSPKLAQHLLIKSESNECSAHKKSQELLARTDSHYELKVNPNLRMTESLSCFPRNSDVAIVYPTVSRESIEMSRKPKIEEQYFGKLGKIQSEIK